MKRRPAWARAALAIVFALGLCCVPTESRAEYRQRVVVLDTSHQDRNVTELLTRLRGELVAAGFDVIVIRANSLSDPRATVEGSGREISPAAVLLAQESFDDELGQSVAKLWVSDRVSRRTLMQSMTLNPGEQGRDRALLAVQVAELLKARFAALTVAEGPVRSAPDPARAESAHPVPTAAEERPVLASLSAGVGMLRGFGKTGVAWAPVVHAGLLLPKLTPFALALEIRGGGALTATDLKLQTDAGSARVSQALAWLDAVVHVGPRSPVQPLLSLGAGAYSVTAAGSAATQFTRRTLRSWSMLSSLGCGLWAQPTRHLAWALEAQLLAAWSTTQVEIDHERVEEFGAPMIFLSTALVGIL